MQEIKLEIFINSLVVYLAIAVTITLILSVNNKYRIKSLSQENIKLKKFVSAILQYFRDKGITLPESEEAALQSKNKNPAGDKLTSGI